MRVAATPCEALVGFEPTVYSHGFADRALRPLGHSARRTVPALSEAGHATLKATPSAV